MLKWGVRLEFGHVSPVTLGHVTHPAFGIITPLYSDRIVKPFPQGAVTGFLLFRAREREIFKREDYRFIRLVHQSFPVGAVKNEKSLFRVAGTEMLSQ